MPSLHSADALIDAAVLFAACRHRWTKQALWLLWRAWVCVIATANHHLADVLADIALAPIALTAVTAAPIARAALASGEPPAGTRTARESAAAVVAAAGTSQMHPGTPATAERPLPDPERETP